MSWLSILVPVYNVLPYLEECLTSIIEQVDEGVEVLVLDDCSTDGSSELLHKLMLRWPGQFHLLQHTHNSGLSAARNTMIEAAKGDYLWFIDSDDKLLPCALHNLASILRSSTPDIILCDFSVLREKTRIKHKLRGELHRKSFAGPSNQLQNDRALLLSGLFSTGQMHAWSKVSRRELWNKSLRFPQGRYFEDLMCMPLLALQCQNFYYCPQPWVAYRQRSTSILSTMTLSKAQDQSAALKGFSQALRHDPLCNNKPLQLALAQQCARNFIGSMRFIARQQQKIETSQIKESVERFHFDFTQASPYSINKLIRIYLQRGWWLRALKLCHWAHWSLTKYKY